MKWRESIFECLLLWCCMACPNELRADVRAESSAEVEDATLTMNLVSTFTDLDMLAESAQTRHEREVARMYRRWLSIIPNLGVFQYAGNIGAGSIGLGWDYGKHERWETLVLVGYVPRHHNQKGDVTFTLRENLVPWSLGLGTRRWAQPVTATYTYGRERLPWNRRAFASFEPAVFTVSLSTIFDDQFWVKEPEKYNGGDYYRFSSKVRLHLGFGSRLSLNVPREHRKHSDRLSIYYELSTYDLAIISAIPSKKITLGDILCLGVGVQLKFF
ncbi:MAG: hypothetical protein K6E86_02470 [Bacteroidales bacterium]|nr:hypothetical protein [Bacteroidales bacterium]